MMKMTVLSLITALFVTFGISQNNPLGKVSFQIGKNYIQSAGQLSWNGLKYKAPVYENDKIKTSKRSRSEITFETKKVLRVGERSIVEITKDDAGEDHVTMSKGLAWLSLFLPFGKSPIKIKTPQSVCAVRGTVYRLECDSNQTTYRCYKGEIGVTPVKEDGSLADSTLSVKAGEELILVMNFEEYKKLQEKQYQDFQQKEMDEFQRFMEQDQKAFEDMKKKDWDDFKKMDNLTYKQDKFDEKEDAASDWVQWNKDRDRSIR
jgi:hypothetical protein